MSAEERLMSYLNNPTTCVRDYRWEHVIADLRAGRILLEQVWPIRPGCWRIVARGASFMASPDDQQRPSIAA